MYKIYNKIFAHMACVNFRVTKSSINFTGAKRCVTTVFSDVTAFVAGVYGC